MLSKEDKVAIINDHIKRLEVQEYTQRLNYKIAKAVGEPQRRLDEIEKVRAAKEGAINALNDEIEAVEAEVS